MQPRSPACRSRIATRVFLDHRSLPPGASAPSGPGACPRPCAPPFREAWGKNRMQSLRRPGARLRPSPIHRAGARQSPRWTALLWCGEAAPFAQPVEKRPRRRLARFTPTSSPFEGDKLISIGQIRRCFYPCFRVRRAPSMRRRGARQAALMRSAAGPGFGKARRPPGPEACPIRSTPPALPSACLQGTVLLSRLPFARQERNCRRVSGPK